MEKGNLAAPRLTRASAKRRPAPEVLAPSKRKRVALAEIPHLANALYPDETQKPKPRRKAPRCDPHDDDPHIFSPYASDIHRYLRSMEAEAKRRPLVNYVEAVQRDMTPAMRGILVDWLVEVAEEYRLMPDTLYLAVSYIDRFLSCYAIDRKKLQLLGVSCMLIASKYEEITPPHVEDFCYITDNTYSRGEVVKMESEILKLLNFEMGNPTTKTFIRRYMKAGHDDFIPSSLQLESLCNYIAELSLLDYSCIRFPPSVIAASVVFLSRFTIDPDVCPWNLGLREQTGYNPLELKECIYCLHELQLNKKASNLKAIREKYRHNKFKCVANLSPLSEIPALYFEDIVVNKL